MADATQVDNPLHRDPDFRKVIIFNGPPNCGKDTASDAVRSFVRVNASYLNPSHRKFAEPLKKAAHAMYDAFHSWDFYDSKDGRAAKDIPNGDFLGLTPRQAYIEVFKKLEEMHGPDVLGRIMRKRMVRDNHTNVFICSDGGRPPELGPIVDLVGQRNVLIVEIHANGVTWEGDIRGYVGDEVQKVYPKVSVIRIPNNIGTKDDLNIFKMLCCGVAKKFLKIEEKDG